jgi:uncharacterized coiled-coil protein SlyX
MARALKGAGCRLPILAILAIGSGCTMVPRSQVADCQRATQTLHTENARLKDQILVFQTQNRDYADRAVDDSRRLAAQEETIERLQQTTLAYQNDVSRLEAAFKQLTGNLGDFAASPAVTHDWPRSGSRSARAKNKNESGSRSPSQSRPDNAAQLR